MYLKKSLESHSGQERCLSFSETDENFCHWNPWHMWQQKEKPYQVMNAFKSDWSEGLGRDIVAQKSGRKDQLAILWKLKILKSCIIRRLFLPACARARHSPTIVTGTSKERAAGNFRAFTNIDWTRAFFTITPLLARPGRRRMSSTFYTR